MVLLIYRIEGKKDEDYDEEEEMKLGMLKKKKG
jgi:hypothetical protein